MVTAPEKARLLKMAQIGELFMKIAGRDAGNICVVIDVLDERFVMIDGQTRRRKCNIFHLEPLHKIVKFSKNASHDVVVKLFKAELNIELIEKKNANKKATTRQKKQKVVKKQATTSKKSSSTKKETVKTKALKKEAKPAKAKVSKEEKTEEVKAPKKD